MDDAIGIDCFDSGGKDFDLWFAQFSVQRMKLAIDIADAKVIEIHQSQLSHA